MADQTQITPEVRTKMEGVLKDAQIPDEAKAQAWDAFMVNGKPEDFKKSFDGIQGLPNPIKLQLAQMRFGQSKPESPAPAKVAAAPHAESAAKKQPGMLTKPLAEPIRGFVEWGAEKLGHVLLPLPNLPKGSEKAGKGTAVVKGVSDFYRGYEKGWGDVAVDMTSPQNLALAGATMLGGGLTGKLGKLWGLAKDVASLGFGGQALADLKNEAPEAYAAYQKGDYEGVGSALAHAMADVVIAGKATQGVQEGSRMLREGKATPEAKKPSGAPPEAKKPTGQPPKRLESGKESKPGRPMSGPEAKKLGSGGPEGGYGTKPVSEVRTDTRSDRGIPGPLTPEVIPKGQGWQRSSGGRGPQKPSVELPGTLELPPGAQTRALPPGPPETPVRDASGAIRMPAPPRPGQPPGTSDVTGEYARLRLPGPGAPSVPETPSNVGPPKAIQEVPQGPPAEKITDPNKAADPSQLKQHGFIEKIVSGTKYAKGPDGKFWRFDPIRKRFVPSTRAADYFK